MAAARLTSEQPASVIPLAKAFIASVTIDIFKADRKVLVVCL
jgi:hypothetical protein